MIRVLVVSSLYPNALHANHGVFVENRLRRTLALGDVEATVIAPIPFFPFSHKIFGSYAENAKVPRSETRHGLEIRHPRHLVVPKIGAPLTPSLMFHALLREVRRLQAEGKEFDVIDAHYFYPDGVAAARLAKELDLPLMITGRGTDLTLIPTFKSERQQIQEACRQAEVLVTVCEDLRLRLLALGAPESHTITLRNGVDLEAFSPKNRSEAKAKYGAKGFTIASVGGLIERKGHHLIIEAMASLPDCTLLIAGEGPMKSELFELAEKFGVASQVKILGSVPHAELAELYSAADIMVLASSREGWANVLLESMACGTPVLATNVNGTSEVVQSNEVGSLVQSRSASAILSGIIELRKNLPERGDVRKYAEAFSWETTVSANKFLLESLANAPKTFRRAEAQLAIRNLTGPDLPPSTNGNF